MNMNSPSGPSSTISRISMGTWVAVVRHDAATRSARSRMCTRRREPDWIISRGVDRRRMRMERPRLLGDLNWGGE